MSVPTRAEYNDIIGKLKRRKVEIRKMIELFEAQNEAIKEGFGCNKSLEEFPDPPEVCDFEILNMTPTNQSGGGRKSRKKRGKGAMASRMSRKKKHMSARKPKSKYVDEAIKILVNDHTYLIADTPERGRRIRNLALELEDNVKKGGRRKRKSRRKTKKRRRSKRRKSRRKRR